MLTDNDAEHLAEIIHARRTAARALETSGRALEGGSARARNWSYFPPPRPPQGPPDPAWLGIVTLGRAVPRLCCWGLWGSGTDYARSPILFLWHRVRWSRTCAARARSSGAGVSAAPCQRWSTTTASRSGCSLRPLLAREPSPSDKPVYGTSLVIWSQLKYGCSVRRPS